MPYLFLSPSTQAFNPYVTSFNEEYWMNLIADRMEAYLLASGVGFVRNDPDSSAAAAIRRSNEGAFDFHLALHSNAAPPGAEGRYRGIDVYYYPASEDGLRMANLLVDNLRTIYPLPDRVQARPTTAIGEVRRTKAPSVLAELGYHDNEDDARWIENSLESIARVLSLSVTEYFGVPFLTPSPIRTGTVTVRNGRLNIRDLPSIAAPILARAENGDTMTVYGENNSWYSVRYQGVVGFAAAAFVVVQN